LDPARVCVITWIVERPDLCSRRVGHDPPPCKPTPPQQEQHPLPPSPSPQAPGPKHADQKLRDLHLLNMQHAKGSLQMRKRKKEMQIRPQHPLGSLPRSKLFSRIRLARRNVNPCRKISAVIRDAVDQKGVLSLPLRREGTASWQARVGNPVRVRGS
jgi:hypothetical protein